MNRHEFNLLLVLAAAARPLYALQIKRAGRFWFLPWSHMPGMVQRGWVFPLQKPTTGKDPPPPVVYEITETGRMALAQEINNRVRT